MKATKITRYKLCKIAWAKYDPSSKTRFVAANIAVVAAAISPVPHRL